MKVLFSASSSSCGPPSKTSTNRVREPVCSLIGETQGEKIWKAASCSLNTLIAASVIIRWLKWAYQRAVRPFCRDCFIFEWLQEYQNLSGYKSYIFIKTLTLHRGEEDLRQGCSLGPFVLRDGFSISGLTAQGHVALHHWIPRHGAHGGRRWDCRDGQTDRVLLS